MSHVWLKSALCGGFQVLMGKDEVRIVSDPLSIFQIIEVCWPLFHLLLFVRPCLLVTFVI